MTQRTPTAEHKNVDVGGEDHFRPNVAVPPVFVTSAQQSEHVNGAKWRRRLAEELDLAARFEQWSIEEWQSYIASRDILNANYDTVVALDWPHYCGGATEGCGGSKGWCYTLAGNVGGGRARSMRAAATDQLARQFPSLFADAVASEVFAHVEAGRMPYANLRFSGSGEVHAAHIPALVELRARGGVRLWGFSRSIDVARQLDEAGICVLFSCDLTTPPARVKSARALGLKLAYTSTGVNDPPPLGTFVTFPVHRSGRVKEVVSADSLCPKVVEEYLDGKRREGACQWRCTRCHQADK
jgi:hypothetical protein